MVSRARSNSSVGLGLGLGSGARIRAHARRGSTVVRLVNKARLGLAHLARALPRAAQLLLQAVAARPQRVAPDAARAVALLVG
eukprot:scaffold77641_cov72-Phaeocystis_antarctica.AAC.1